MITNSPTRRDFLRQVGAAGLTLAASNAVAGCAPGRTSPNVVLIFLDDLGYGDVGVYGAQGFNTPNLDRLANEGMRFTDFYASQAVCSASRASLLTGCYAERVSIRGALGPFAEVGLNVEEDTIADLLKQRGYATGMVGKWHLGHHEEFLPQQHGFDEYLGIPYSNDMWPVDYDGNPVTEGHKLTYPALPLIDGNSTVETIDDLDEQATITTRYTERAVEFISRNEAGPFFLYLAHSMPHVPLGVSDKFRGHSTQGMYGDVIEEIDWSVGQVLSALERFNLTEETLVIFTSDNGPWLNYGNHAGSTGGLREGKGTAFEGGPRVPAIVRWPGEVEPGAICTEMASTIDLLPTIVEITGAPMPEKKIDGVSILPLLAGVPDVSPRTQFYFYYTAELRGVREGKWKRVYEHRTRSYVGVEPGNDGHPGPYASPTVPAALYDLENDRNETTDVSAANPQVVARLDALAAVARETLGDRLTGSEGSEVRLPGRRGFRRENTVTHLAVGAQVTLTNLPSSRYPANGAESLVDGMVGSRDFNDRHWLGFEGIDMEATLDFGEERRVSRIGVDCLRSQISWIFYPRAVQFEVSVDGTTWSDVGSVDLVQEPDPIPKTQLISMEFEPRGARYVRVRSINVGRCPDWHLGAGGQAWVFVDEIVVE